MTAVQGPQTKPVSVDLSVGRPTELRPVSLPSLCPYLATPEGNWRSAKPVREHHCMAVSPPVQLAPAKQLRLCLVEAHVTCATYGAALAARPNPPERRRGHTRPVARMTPMILDHGRFDLQVPAVRTDRLSQGILVLVLGLAFVAILLARPSGDTRAVLPLMSDASPAPSVSAAAPSDETGTPSADPTDAPAPSDDPTTTPRPSTGPDGSPGSVASPEPTLSGDTYRVKSGDTLTAIAGRFNTTPQILARLNDIADPSKLKIGQILILP